MKRQKRSNVLFFNDSKTTDPRTIPIKLCLLWKRGKFHSPISSSSKILQNFFNEDIIQQNNHQLFTTYSENFGFRQGRWMIYNSVEKHSLAVPWLSYVGMRKCFEGSHIIFQGDSLMRQMFNRLIHYIRGYDIFIEHFYHFDAKYSFNATHDLLTINEIDTKETVMNPLFVSDFVWDPVLDNTKLFKSSIHHTNTLFIVGLHHWIRSEPACQKFEKYKSNRTLFVTVPTLNTPDEPTIRILTSRNKWIYKNSNLFIPLNEMTATNAFQTNDKDHFHFQCAYLSERENWAGWMAPVAVIDNEAKIKTPKSGDCRDMINLNIAMIIAYHRMVHSS